MGRFHRSPPATPAAVGADRRQHPHAAAEVPRKYGPTPHFLPAADKRVTGAPVTWDTFAAALQAAGTEFEMAVVPAAGV
eukprot:gene1435-42790_t